METNRAIRLVLGVATLLAATFVFEPTLFGAPLSAGWIKAEMLRNIVGIAGAVFGLLLIFDAVFPKPPPRPAAPEPAPAAEPPPEDPTSVAQEAAEAVWGSYVEPAPGVVEAARGLVEAELAEREQAAAETAPPEPRAETPPETPEIKVGNGLPPPPPKPPKPPKAPKPA